MTLMQVYMAGHELEHSGWRWETWSGDFEHSTAKGWWILRNASVGDVRGMRRGDPRPYDYATVTTHELYYQQESK